MPQIEGKEILIAATRQARAIICRVDEINFLSGPGRGVILIKLQTEDDRVLGFIASTGDRDLLAVETTRGAEQTISTTKYEVTGRGGKGRELLQRGQFTRVVPVGPEAPEPLGRSPVSFSPALLQDVWNLISSPSSKKHMASPASPIGEFEQLVLLALVRLGDKAYGVPITDEIQRRASEKWPSAPSTRRWIVWNRRDSWLRRSARRPRSGEAAARSTTAFSRPECERSRRRSRRSGR